MRIEKMLNMKTKMITENDITFENEIHDGRKIWQDIIVDGKPVAALGHKLGSFLKPMEMWIQKLLPETEIPKIKRHYIAEDVGMVFGVWDFETEFEEFIKYLNQYQK